MTVFSGFHPTSLYAGDYPRATRAVTVLSGNTVVRGQLVGKVTTSGKYVPSVRTASDGSQTPVGIIVEAVDASGADAAGKIYDSGQFAFEVMTVDASWTLAQLQAALFGTKLYVESVGAVA